MGNSNFESILKKKAGSSRIKVTFKEEFVNKKEY